MDFDTAVKLIIYETLSQTAQAPDAAAIAATLSSPIRAVQATLQRLAQQRLIVLEPGHPDRIRMALPFSGIETPHQVHIEGKRYFANCAWDALGIPAALGIATTRRREALIHSTCPDCGESIRLEVSATGLAGEPWLAHFAVPAARWWADIIYT